MASEMKVQIERNTQSGLHKVDFNNLGFGKVYTDHMLVCDYANGEWNTPKIIPFQNLSLNPATAVLHYGQTIFEGLKAFKDSNNDILLFRSEDNFNRMNHSAERLCMPSIPREVFIDGLIELLKIDESWFPKTEGSSMYIRPLLFATDAEIRVKPSDTYRFLIILSPSGAYYSEPVKVIVEKTYVRASNGGLGYAKTAANYAASLYPAKLAQQKGYHQLIWTDSKEHKYVEEAGTMNFMFIINNTLITPELGDSILPGITRASILTLAKEWGLKVEERKVTIDEIITAAKNNLLTEAFGAGTAATISHISDISNDGIDYHLSPISDRPFSSKVGKFLNDLKLGNEVDTHNWITKISI